MPVRTAVLHGMREGEVMGPTDGVFGVDRAADYVLLIGAMEAAHPTLTYLRPQSPGAPHGAAWDDDEGSHKVTFDHLRDLYRFLALRFGER